MKYEDLSFEAKILLRKRAAKIICLLGELLADDMNCENVHIFDTESKTILTYLEIVNCSIKYMIGVIEKETKKEQDQK